MFQLFAILYTKIFKRKEVIMGRIISIMYVCNEATSIISIMKDRQKVKYRAEPLGTPY